jgi:hypothetical protein
VPKVIRISSLLTCRAPAPRAAQREAEPEAQDRQNPELPLRAVPIFREFHLSHSVARFSMTRKFSSSIPTSTVATCARPPALLAFLQSLPPQFADPATLHPAQVSSKGLRDRANSNANWERTATKDYNFLRSRHPCLYANCTCSKRRIAPAPDGTVG